MIEDETITGIKDLVSMIIERDKRIAELEADNRKLSEIEQRRIGEAITQADSIAELREQLAELRELLTLIRDDLRMRSEDGVVDISDFIWMSIDKVLQEKGE